MPKPFVNYIDETRQLYSGDSADMIPFLSVRQDEGKVIFQIPGGGSLESPPALAFEFASSIIDVSLKALEYDTSHKHNWATRYISINNADQVSGMYCTECNEVLHQDDVEDLLNK